MIRKTAIATLLVILGLCGLVGTAAADPAHQVPSGPGRDHLNSNIGCVVQRQNIGDPSKPGPWGAVLMCTTHGKQLATLKFGQ